MVCDARQIDAHLTQTKGGQHIFAPALCQEKCVVLFACSFACLVPLAAVSFQLVAFCHGEESTLHEKDKEAIRQLQAYSMMMGKGATATAIATSFFGFVGLEPSGT